MFFLCRTSYWSTEDKVERHPVWKFSRKPSRKTQACMPLYLHLKIIDNVQGSCQYINARHAKSKYLNIATSGEKNPGSLQNAKFCYMIMTWEAYKFFWSHKIAQTLSHVLGMNLLDQYFCPKNSPTHKIEEF